MKRGEKLTRWFMFGVLIACVPLMGRAFDLFIQHGEWRLDLTLQGGEIFLIAPALAAQAIGELIPTPAEHLAKKLVAAGASIILIIFTSLCFTNVRGSSTESASSIATASLLILVGTVATSGLCMYLANGDDR